MDIYKAKKGMHFARLEEQIWSIQEGREIRNPLRYFFIKLA